MEDEEKPVEPGEIKREGANVTIGAPVVIAVATGQDETSDETPDKQEDK